MKQNDPQQPARPKLLNINDVDDLSLAPFLYGPKSLDDNTPDDLIPYEGDYGIDGL